jgi:GNAT superfamily N-acetyltransferase
VIVETMGRLHLDPFEITLKDIGEVDVEQLHTLSVAVGWPHRDDDWRTLLELGQGIAAVDDIGRVVGSVMWLRYGPGFTMVGMLITSPRLQEQGAGRWLMERVHALNPGSAFGLTATHAARRLYRSMGYGYEEKVLQCQGHLVGVPPSVAARGLLRAVTADDHASIIRLDRAALGCDRSGVLARLLAVSDGQVLVRDGEIVAFALCRRFGRERVLGPVVAAREGDAIAVSRPHVQAQLGGFLRADTPESNTAFTEFLVGSGMQIYDSVTAMGLGRAAYRPAVPDGPRRIALASQALG